ncbi:hypothetical protein [Chondromyces apiculatus]|uniref:Uncharacterized protein n=1 Tax=Chondromyces apiculatus DSM 436 TaxID=1192034 RepID=A0A017T529_9BACT|nr:hypothetical protein [Chondromyces apiculatus]EYF04082.1 Hypothetical protein CAP_4956 [Chondromyces apiculatus DSM 436]
MTQEITSPTGTKYRVDARMGTADDKRVPAKVRIELLGNPTRADIDVRCETPLQFATDPADVFSTSCRAFERTGSKSLVGTRLLQRAVTLRIVGDGRILLELDGAAASAP